jgi:5'-methylthioadenosine phosphorylase
VGLEGHDDIKPVTHEEVLKVFNSNVENVKKVLFEMVKSINLEYQDCKCCEL